MVVVRKLVSENIDSILRVESKSFIPPLQATRDTILKRLGEGHTYLGAFGGNGDGEMTGIASFRSGYFSTDFRDFLNQYHNFKQWVDGESIEKGNALLIYNLGVVPTQRNGIFAKSLIDKIIELGRLNGKEFVAGDGRIPSYNGSNYPGYEFIKQNPEVKKAFDDYLNHGGNLSKSKVTQDKLLGFYLRVFPNANILGATGPKFIPEDVPAGGHRVILYERIRALSEFAIHF